MRFELGEDVVLAEVGLVVAGDKVRVAHVVGGADRVLAETQVGLRNAEGLLGVVLKVSLAVHVGRLADDLDRVFVRADGAVRAETPELAGDRAFRLGEQGRADREGEMGHVVVDTDREVILRRVERQIVENGLDLGGRGVLGGQTVAAGIDHRAVRVVDISRADVLIQRLAVGAGFLETVEHGDLFHGLRDRAEHVLHGERAEQVDLQEADLLAALVQVVHSLADGAGDGAHRNDQALCVGCAIVVEQVIFTAGQLADLGHIILNDVGQSGIVAVAGLALLEVDVGVVDHRAHARIFGVQRVGAEFCKGVIVDELGKVGILKRLDLLDLMAGAEAVEEVHERDPCLDGGQVGDAGQIDGFLDGAGVQHRKAGLAAVHHVGVIAEDRECVCADGTGSHMQNAGQTLAGQSVHGGNHQHQALRGGEGCSQSAGFQSAVTSADGAGFRLHLHQTDGLAKDVLQPVRGPLVGVFRHGGRRGDRVDRGDFGESIRDVRSSFVAVHNLHDLAHCEFSSL